MAIINRTMSMENKNKLVQKVRRHGYTKLIIRDMLGMFGAKCRGNNITKTIDKELNKIGLCAPDFGDMNKSIDKETYIFPMDIYHRVKPLERYRFTSVSSIRFAANYIKAKNESEPIFLVRDLFRSALIRAVPVVDDYCDFKGVVFRNSVEVPSHKKTAIKNFTEPIQWFHEHQNVGILLEHFLKNPDSVVAVENSRVSFAIICLCDILAALHE